MQRPDYISVPPVAHSARAERGVPPQLFWEHIHEVTKLAVERCAAAAAYRSGDRERFCAEVKAAAEFHDCGKLCPENQGVLGGRKRDKLPIDHTDAGTALLLAKGDETAAMLVRSHHCGLPSVPEERRRVTESPPGKAFRNRETLRHTEENKGLYLAEYETAGVAADGRTGSVRDWPGLTHRIALSCLVDADHSDTARHYRELPPAKPPKAQWRERLSALDAYVARLAGGGQSGARNQQRAAVYAACREAEIWPALRTCEAPVGTGKTTAVMAHLLRAADEKSLRHILVVLPYTNIIQQSVDVYRKALVLEGEKPEDVVAELHHLADFDSVESRHMAALWDAPITVTTAVQFFETLAANQPAKLRKLHELPGSAVFIDEEHTAIPAWLWPQTWLWIKELVEHWSCHFVLGSGSLARFWTMKTVTEPAVEVPDLLPAELRIKLEGAEKSRVTLRRRPDVMGLAEALAFIRSREGPRLVILNTVQNASVIADELRRSRGDALHLSTALAPVDRRRIVDLVKARLADKCDNDWTLVATSCVEAGVDFSFRSSIRESCSVASAIQTGGRTNRHGDETGCEVWDVRLEDPLLKTHPGFADSRRVLADLFEEGALDRLSPAEAVTAAIRREILLRYRTDGDELKKQEHRLDFIYVAQKYRVIDADTRLVVVTPALVRCLDAGEPASSREIMLNSVQIWARRLEELKIEEFRRFRGLYKWSAQYDPEFLGYMAGVLPLIRAGETGLHIV